MKKTIHANGIMMAYQIDGPEAAPVVVMSNSLMSSLEMWDDTIVALTAHYRVVRYDTLTVNGLNVKINCSVSFIAFSH